MLMSVALCVASVLRTLLSIGGPGLAEAIYDACIACAATALCLRALVPDPAHKAFVCATIARCCGSAAARSRSSTATTRPSHSPTR
jgi:hypothetical protein